MSDRVYGKHIGVDILIRISLHLALCAAIGVPGAAWADGLRARFITPPWPGGWSNMQNSELQSAVIEVQGAPANATLAIVAATGIEVDSTAEEISARLGLATPLSGSEKTISGDGSVTVDGIYPPGLPAFYQLWITVNGEPVLPWEGDDPAPGDFWALWGQTLYEGPRLQIGADLTPSYIGGAGDLSGTISLDIQNEPWQEWEWRTGYRWALEQGSARVGEVCDFVDGLSYLKGADGGQDNAINAQLPSQWDWPAGGGALKLRVGRWDESANAFAEPEENEFDDNGPEIVLHEACTAPGVPSNLNGTPGSVITISWNPVNGAEGYLVRYGNAQSGYTVAETTSNAFSFEASSGQSYEARVRAWAECGNDWRVYSEKSESITVQAEGVTVQLDVSPTVAAPGDTVRFTNNSMISGEPQFHDLGGTRHCEFHPGFRRRQQHSSRRQ